MWRAASTCKGEMSANVSSSAAGVVPIPQPRGVAAGASSRDGQKSRVDGQLFKLGRVGARPDNESMTPTLRLVGQAGPKLLGVACSALLHACTPTLNWREVRPEGLGITLEFPCKPSVFSRPVVLAAAPLQLVMHACSAGGATWAMASADVGDPTRVAAVLSELFAAAARNVDAGEPRALPLSVLGATPNPSSRHAAFTGRLPDGQPVREYVAVFAKGTRVFQATVVDASAGHDAIDTYFGAMRFAR